MSGRKYATTHEDAQLARRIREVRAAAKLTQAALAARAGISSRTLKRIEAGRARVSLSLLRQLERILPGLGAMEGGDVTATAAPRVAPIQVTAAEVFHGVARRPGALADLVELWALSPAPESLTMTYDEWILVKTYRALPREWQTEVQSQTGAFYRRFTGGLSVESRESYEVPEVSLEEALTELHMDELEIDDWTGELVEKESQEPMPGEGETFVNRPAGEVRDLARGYDLQRKKRAG